MNVKSKTKSEYKSKKRRYLILFVISLFLLPIGPPILILVIYLGFKYLTFTESKLNRENKTNNHITQHRSKNFSHDMLKKPISFSVKGVSKKNNEGYEIQSIIKCIVKDIKEELDSDDLYEGLTKKEILDELENNCDNRIYEINDESFFDISLVPDPTNEFDSKAIKIVSDEYGHLGFVPRDLTDLIHERLKYPIKAVYCTITGGKYKYYDDESERIESDETYYGLIMTIK